MAVVDKEWAALNPALKAFCFETYYGGISYVAVLVFDQRSSVMAEAIAYRHKYNTKRDRWYAIVNDVRTPSLVNGVFPIWKKWAQSNEMEEKTEEIDKLLKTTYIKNECANGPRKPR